MNAPEMNKWIALARPPASALKQIKGGRLNGMSDVNPQWRYKAMHDVFGPCGTGWKYSIEKIWTEQGTDGQVFMFVQVNVCVKENGEWSAPIPGVGGSMLLEAQRNGIHHNDEAVKMATTDALSVALKMLGVAADIYMGRWDGSKYKDDPEPKKMESFKSIGKAEGETLSEATQAKYKLLADEIIEGFDKDNPEVAYEQYAQIRDEVIHQEPDSDAVGPYFRSLFPSNIKTAFTKIYNSRQSLAGVM